MKINVLPQSIANMIAAGEVVERPASVVKELAENSVDAGAKSITVEIKKGGMSYIRITDDGCGIAPAEVLTAFKRHATSKIKTEEDLNAIYTLGFRGEALASIAAVARVDIFTKTRDDSFGYSASIEGGEVIESGEAGCPDGTTITVRDLFFNTPARMKFLKSDATETSYVTDAVHKLILSHPEVAVKLIVNGKTTLSSPGDGNGLSAVRAVFGKDYIPHMNEVSYEEDGIKVAGYIGSNALARKDRRQQVFFMNGRYIRSKIISSALGEAYQNVMMVGKFPVAVLSVTVSGSFVDVNVHPTKIEVRFSDDKKVYNAIYWAVKNALSAKKYVPEIEMKKQSEEIMNVRRQISKEQNKSVQMDINLLKDTYIKSLEPQKKEPHKNPVPEAAAKQEKPASVADIIKERIDENTFFTREDMSSFNETLAKADVPKEDAFEIKKADTDIFKKKTSPGETQMSKTEAPDIAKEHTQAPKAEVLQSSVPKADVTQLRESIEPVIETPDKPVAPDMPGVNTDFAIVGQIFNTYIIVQRDDEMLIIDQHAAHERIYFEELLEEYRSRGIKSQLLLIPVTLDFDPVRFATVIANLDTFSSLGFECEEFGTNSIIIRSVPSLMTDGEIKDTVIDITELLEKGTADIKKTLMEDVLHTMACKRAIKGNSKLTQIEMETLTQKVLSFDTINTCPHGRPIMTSMTRYELEKNFKRIV